MAELKIHATRRLLGANVRRLRKRRKWSQEDLASAARMEQPDISKVERALLSTGVDIIQRIARALGVRVADLLDESKIEEKMASARKRGGV